MTDYEKLCNLLKEMNCNFSCEYPLMNENNIAVPFIEIMPESIISFGGVFIEFYEDGSFRGFGCCE